MMNANHPGRAGGHRGRVPSDISGLQSPPRSLRVRWRGRIRHHWLSIGSPGHRFARGCAGSGSDTHRQPRTRLAGNAAGTYFRIPSMALIPAEHLRAAFTEAFSTFLIALLVLLLLFHIVGYA